MNWSLEQLNSFIAAAEQGSFSAAGRILGRAQSVVSTHIASLEADLGIELFSREGRTPRLTAEGKELLEEARAVQKQCKKFDQRALAQFKGEGTSLKLAVGSGMPIHLIAESLIRLNKKYPQITGDITVCPNKEVLTLMEEGAAHLGIIFDEHQEKPENCEVTYIGAMEHVLVVSANHPLAHKKNVSLSDLNQYCQILLGDNDFNRQNGISSPMSWKTNEVFMGAELVLRGMGWSYIPVQLVQAFQSRQKDLPVVIPSVFQVVHVQGVQIPPNNMALLNNSSYKHRAIISDLKQILEKIFLDATNDDIFLQYHTK